MKILNKFKCAFKGIIIGLKHPSILVQVIFGILAILVFYLLNINYYEWLIILLCIGSVILSEYFNTVIEKISDYLNGDYDLKIKVIKDLSAGCVLISAIMSAIIGLIILIKHVGGII